MVKTLIEKVTEDLYLLRLDDDQVKYFEALWYIPEGITYNAYLLITRNKVILFDTWKHIYAKEFIDTLTRVVDIKDVDYIVVHHMEPDHSGAIPKVLELNGYRAEVLGHPLVKMMLESFYRVKPKFRPLRDGEEINIDGKKLKFIHTPWLHWPETIMTYLVDDKVLLSGDAFGGFSVPPSIFDDEEGVVAKYIPYSREYVASIVGHYKEHIVKNIEKIGKLGIEVKIIAPSHGIVWRRAPNIIIDYYMKWAKAAPERGKIVVIYSSMYGFVEKAVSIAIKELTEQGYQPVVLRFTDSHYDTVNDLLGEVIDAEALVIAAATYETSIFPYMQYVVNMIAEKIASEKPVLILSSYGWGGIAGKRIASILSQAGFKVVDIIEFRGLPAGDTEENIKRRVKEFIKILQA